jgi:hypothetical protein
MLVQEADPDTAPIVRELFARLKAGHSIRGSTIDFGGRESRCISWR